MRKFQTIELTNTVEEWVQAFNNNALSAADHTWYLGEMLYNGMLYTGLESIGGVPIKSLSNLNVSTASAQNIELDNFYLYFRDINKILLVDQVTFDLRPYNDGHPHFFYINSKLGFRISQKFAQKDDEILLFRFILQPNEKFSQMYVTAQRFGSNVYDTADEYYLIKGCMPQPAETKMRLKLGNGTIKRSGILFDNHQVPDVYTIEDKEIPFSLRYITNKNQINFSQAVTKLVDTTKILNYKTNVLSTLPDDTFSVQRILYDVYTDCLIMQYGDTEYPDLRTALSSIGNVTYPFPYNELMFIPLGNMFVKSNCTDLSDPEQCIITQQLSTTIDYTQSTFFAQDDYARGRLKVIQGEIKKLEDRMDAVEKRLTDLEDAFDDHIHDYNNPHKVTKSQVGLGNVPNWTGDQFKDYAIGAADKLYVSLTKSESISGNKHFNNQLSTQNNYIKLGNNKLYIGDQPSNPSPGDFWLPNTTI